MAVDRFTRFKLLQALWARARALMVRLARPHAHEARLRATRWQHIQVAERHLRDGIVRDTGDPDGALRPPPPERRDAQRQAWHEAQRRADEARRAWLGQQRMHGQQHRRR